MERSTSSDYVGKARQKATQTCRQYLGRKPAAPGTAVASSLVFQALEDEKTFEDVLANPRRRIGVVHDSAELLHGRMAASDCERAAIQLTVGSPEAIGATHLLRARSEVRPNDTVHVTTFEITPTRRAYAELAEDAVLRTFDHRDNQDVRGLRQLHSEGRRADSAVWKLLDENRERERVAVVLIPSPRNEPTANAIGWAHWLAALYDAGLIDAKRRKKRLKAKDLVLPAEFFKPISRLEKLRRFNTRLADYAGVIEDTVSTIKRILKISLMLVGAILGGLVGASHTDALKDQARQLLESIIGR